MKLASFAYKYSLALSLGILAVNTSVYGAESPLEEIIVKGQGGIGSLQLGEQNGAGSRLGLSSFETPASIEIITQEAITTKGDYSALDAITRSTGISASANPGNGGSSVSSRGFNGHNTTINTYDGTRLYVTAGTVTFPADTWTLDRVEVLRGAGSVINGVGALGATINYIPKRPDFDGADFEALVAAGSFGMQRLAVGGGNQLNDNWAYRIDASHQEKDGFVDRADEQRDVIAGSLLFAPSQDFSLKLSMDYADIEAAPYWGTPLINGSASSSHRQNNYNFADGSVEFEDLWTRARMEWQLSPNVTFRNDTFFLEAEREWQNLEEYAYNSANNTVDRAYYLGIIHDQEQYGNRFDFLINSDLGGMSNTLTVGAEVNVIDMNYHNNFTTGGFGVSDSVPVFGFNAGPTPEATIPTILDYTTDTKQFAVFFDNVIDVTEKLSLVLGGRYDEINFDRFDLAIGGSPSSKIDANFSDFTGRVGLVYQTTENLSFYAQASTAADPVSSPVSLSGANKDFDLSRGQQYELGVKQQLLDGKAEYTLAYFNIEKKDLLTQRPASAITEQIGQQSSDGFEFTFKLNPIDTLSIDFNASFVDAQFDEYFSGGVSLAGNAPRNIPETTANLWINWVPTSNLQLGGGVRYVDDRYTNDANTQKLPSYKVFDASVSWAMSDNLSVVLRARNLTDEEDYVLSQYTADQWVFGEPRSYELSVKYSL